MGICCGATRSLSGETSPSPTHLWRSHNIITKQHHSPRYLVRRRARRASRMGSLGSSLCMTTIRPSRSSSSVEISERIFETLPSRVERWLHLSPPPPFSLQIPRPPWQKPPSCRPFSPSQGQFSPPMCPFSSLQPQISPTRSSFSSLGARSGERSLSSMTRNRLPL